MINVSTCEISVGSFGSAVGFDPGFVKNFINFSVVLNHVLHPMAGEHHSTATDSLPLCPSPPAGKLPIPLNSPVFFAMKCSGEDEYNFVLEPKTSQ